METKSLFCLALAVTGCLAAPMMQDPNHLGQLDFGSKDKDHKAIVELTKFVRDHLALDVQENRRFAERSNNQTEDIANAIIQHVSDLNRNATTKFEETLKKLQTAIEENLNTIVDQTRDNHEKLETRSKDNEEHISKEAAKNFNDLLKGIKARLSQHERMLNTHVAVCADQYNNIAHGKVVYEHNLMESVIVGGERTKSHVLDPSQGEFTVPEGADGTYQISFTAIIDTLKDIDNNLIPASFVFGTKQAGGGSIFHPMSSTTLTATVGRPRGDKVPASRSILLDLEAGEKVAIFQTREGAESSYRLTFCANLIRPTAPAAWEALPDLMEAPEIKSETTYVEPDQKPLVIDDLTINFEQPEVKMPVAESALLFPKTNFYKKIPTSGVAAPHIALGDPLGSAGDPNKL